MKMRNTSPSRRGVLQAGLAAGGSLLFTRGARAATLGFGRGPSAQADGGNVLVVLELAGGNDGLNTVVPYENDVYHNARPELRVKAEDVLKIDEQRGFNPLLANLKRFWDAGAMAIVEGAGYPQPNRSHFASFDIWRAGDRRGRMLPTGWLGRTLEAMFGDDRDPNRAFQIGGTLPYSFKSPKQIVSCFESPGSYRRLRGEGDVDSMSESGGADVLGQVQDVFQAAQGSSEAVQKASASYKPTVEYPETPLGAALRTAAALIQSNVGVRIINVEHGGFDTHVLQAEVHPELLTSWDGALSAFLDDLAGTSAAGRTTVMVYSEFGRRVAENASGGTDHGVAGPMFLFGPKVKGGLYGEHPSLEVLDEGDLIHTTDFRSVYSTVLQQWLAVDPAKVLFDPYPVLPILA